MKTFLTLLLAVASLVAVVPSPATADCLPLCLPSDAGSGHDADSVCVPGVPPTIELEEDVETFGYFLLPYDRVDIYRFSVDAPANIQVQMDPTPSIPDNAIGPNYDLRLLDSNCEIIAESSNPGSLPEQINIGLPPGLYKVRVYVPLIGDAPFPPNAGPLIDGRQTVDAADAKVPRHIYVPFYCDPVCQGGGYMVVQR